MIYDPNSQASRRDLAVALAAKLNACGFVRQPATRTSKEDVYVRSDGDITVKVYTSIRNGEARRVGSDAIRVCATKRIDGSERGWIKTRRIHRTGTIFGIVDRTYNRMRTVWLDAKNRS